ncbi:MAG: threonine ammonia-lyase, biosynthetic [Succinivibrio sp.]|jgi:threonine dehydratase|nr:threonine ammonia-lyase, biosynthetic [Succinivibrio sp.]MBR1613271.1 threonine ammonia-lyase, biosynthetic [Succinivibrio sp.]
MVEKQLDAQGYLKKILLARIYDLVKVTPLQKLDTLSSRLGVNVLLKREDYQHIHSFKLRGAYHKIKNLDDAQLKAGIITASAGNHAQGVALSAKNLGITAVIVMPTTTPDLKIDAVRSYGAEVVLYGSCFNESYDYAQQLSKKKGLTMIPPYDDEDVIAGQGTIAHELIGQCDNIDTIYVQIGGGGLAAGIAVYIKSLLPHIKVIGVESEGSACMKAALKAGSPVDIGYVSHFADGVAVSKAGTETFRVLSKYIDDIVTCSNDEICAAMKDIFDDTRAIAEPSGALSLAGLKKYVREHNIKSGNHIAILSGANVKFHTLRMVAERCDVGEMAEGIMAVEIPEKSGAFLDLTKTLGDRVVTEFSYRYSQSDKAMVFASVELTDGKKEMVEIGKALKKNGYTVTDLTDDTLAKDHMRYMVGGHPHTELNERLFLFEFPATANALPKFLETLGDAYNITLFHFRITGLEFCSVLCALDVTGKEDNVLDFVKSVGYPVEEVTDNAAYRLFVK